eukprot:TRINITY_DN796_c1_g6_i2.p1 TRINITY_DN796_c1_g6~~TRINITY_DN796_c1_g6_i2.p1  ORF type:complete len:196 (-),score=82.00 TRINITY_DN796_c1_g6_i2:169-711(-)
MATAHKRIHQSLSSTNTNKSKKNTYSIANVKEINYEDKTKKGKFNQSNQTKKINQTNQTNQTNQQESLNNMMQKLGLILAKFHSADLIHGDLTTSNVLIREIDFELVLIDFGLSYTSTMIEDKAVDLYVLERAFLSTHPNTEQLFQLILDSYAQHAKKGNEILARLEKVRQRGRKKLAFG